MLLSLSGLPGAGKTTIAPAFASEAGAVHLQIDSIERAIRESGLVSERDNRTYRAAYDVACVLAGDNLRLGRIVIADCVNPTSRTRDAWVAIAKVAGAKPLEVEILLGSGSPSDAGRKGRSGARRRAGPRGGSRLRGSTNRGRATTS